MSQENEGATSTVVILWHVHVMPNGDEDTKLIGVYRTEHDAKAAIERLREKPGFRDEPNGFQYHPYLLNRDGWTEGYETEE